MGLEDYDNDDDDDDDEEEMLREKSDRPGASRQASKQANECLPARPPERPTE